MTSSHNTAKKIALSRNDAVLFVGAINRPSIANTKLSKAFKEYLRKSKF